jgi:hypothetical protein
MTEKPAKPPLSRGWRIFRTFGFAALAVVILCVAGIGLFYLIHPEQKPDCLADTHGLDAARASWAAWYDGYQQAGEAGAQEYVCSATSRAWHRLGRWPTMPGSTPR